MTYETREARIGYLRDKLAEAQRDYDAAPRRGRTKADLATWVTKYQRELDDEEEAMMREKVIEHYNLDREQINKINKEAR